MRYRSEYLHALNHQTTTYTYPYPFSDTYMIYSLYCSGLYSHYSISELYSIDSVSESR